ETDDLREHVAREHRRARRLLVENDRQQDAAREVLAGLGVLDFEFDLVEDELLHVGERDVGARLRVIEAAVRVFLDDSLTHGGRQSKQRPYYIARQRADCKAKSLNNLKK